MRLIDCQLPASTEPNSATTKLGLNATTELEKPNDDYKCLAQSGKLSVLRVACPISSRPFERVKQLIGACLSVSV